ncbi:Spc97/Spc98 family protein [Truncatella angustata]|uniref:Spindle pole body component n=1 Tax=Truncatella angustata TaxID=152316 RepID=A0A9P8UV32_9PEZI|nr:Spc97/Spc98 family protein [Truncatella angustata]KAH6659739.1 Spc97/Spc98 family protein [Truncatella angustata]
MLHEILFSLSGHPSPLLRNEYSDASARSLLSAPERELLRTAGHLSELHCNLIQHTTQISASHSSIICRSVSTAISSAHLAAFQRKILDVEDGILRKDAGLVGAYNIVPLTAVIGEFSDWTRRLEWLWDLVKYMSKQREGGTLCTGADLMNKLRDELQTGYADIMDTALALIQVAETAWLKQMSAWVLYGRLPNFGVEDFFVRKNEEDELGYDVDYKLVPSCVTSSCVSSMLFIGTSLNRVRAMNVGQPTLGGLGHLSSQLHELSKLSFPLNSSSLSRAVTAIRSNLSRTILQKLLPLGRVVEMLQVLRQFMLVGRGEFAMALTQQADERNRGRWRRADNLAYQKRDSLGTIVVKEGEASAVLARTWVALGSMRGEHAEEDEELELARDLLQLSFPISQVAVQNTQGNMVATPFRNLLLSSPVELTVRIPAPLDLFLSMDDAQIYTCINSYLLSIRRAHLRLMDLWKVTRLRRHHRAPPRAPFSMTKAGTERTETLRTRWADRSLRLRSTWTTSSAVIFFLAEVEAFLQIEIVEELWTDFHSWLSREHSLSRPTSSKQLGVRNTNTQNHPNFSDIDVSARENYATVKPAGPHDIHTPPKVAHHDPQTLSVAHRSYLRCLTQRLLLTQPTFTECMYNLLIHTDHLVALIHRLDGVWSSMDLEIDEGVVDAFSNLEAEEADVKSKLRELEIRVKKSVEEVIEVLRALSIDPRFLTEMEEGSTLNNEESQSEEDGGQYIPKRTGGVDRLLMKLDFGGWFDSGPKNDISVEDDGT